MTIPDHIMARARDLTHMIFCEVGEDGRPYIPADEILTIACSILAAVQEEREKIAALVEGIGIPRVIAKDRILMLPPDLADLIRNRSVTEGEVK